MENIRVLIIERDQNILNKILIILKNIHFIEIVGLAQDVEEGINILNKKPVDVVVVSYLLLENEVLEKYYSFISNNIRLKKIILSLIEMNDLNYNVFKIESSNIILNNDIDLIPDILCKVYKASYYSPTILEKVREEFSRLKKLEEEMEAKRIESLLTPTEIIILKLIEQGLTQSEIAKELVISVRTVKNHVNNILRKMNEKSSREAASKAKAIGVI